MVDSLRELLVALDRYDLNMDIECQLDTSFDKFQHEKPSNCYGRSNIKTQSLLPLPQKTTHFLQLPLNNSNMLPTPRNKPYPKRFRPCNKLLLIRIRINLHPHPRNPINLVLNPKSPEQSRQHPPLRPLS